MKGPFRFIERVQNDHWRMDLTIVASIARRLA